MTSISIHASQRPGTASINAAGLTLAIMTGAIHLLWALLVAAGLGQRVIDIVFRLHLIHPAYVIDAFSPLRAALLVVLSAAAGYTIGAAFAALWNRLQR